MIGRALLGQEFTDNILQQFLFFKNAQVSQLTRRNVRKYI